MSRILMAAENRETPPPFPYFPAGPEKARTSASPKVGRAGEKAEAFA